MDGVITNTMPDHFDAWLKIFASIGMKINCYDIYKREGQDGLSSIIEICRDYGLRLTREQAEELLAEKEELFQKTARVRFVKGSRTFLRFLKRKGYALALVTGTSRKEIPRILPEELAGMFAVSVAGDEIEHSKPHPEPFLKALKKLGLSARDAVVIENAPFGIWSAKRAGLFCIALETSLPKKYLLQADAIFASFAELKKNIPFPAIKNRGARK